MESLENFVRPPRPAAPNSRRWSPRRRATARPRARKTSTGTFEFQRPNRFRFDYRKPFEQTIVADGQTLWLYDVDLNQVTLAQAGQGAGHRRPRR